MPRVTIIYVVRLPVYVQWNGILWHASQIYMYMHSWWNQSRVALKQCRLCDVNCIESDSHSAGYTRFMLETINAMIFKLILPYDYWPGS